MNVLIVEDDILEAARLSDVLKSNFPEATIDTIATGSEFEARFDEIANSPPDLFIIDVMLRWSVPGANATSPDEFDYVGPYRAGFRCQRLLTQDTPTRSIPIILYTVLKRDDLQNELRDLPLNVFHFYKGDDPNSLVRLVRAVIGLGSSVRGIQAEFPDSTERIIAKEASKKLDEGNLMSGMPQPIEVFFSYSHSDDQLRDQLEKHLFILKRQGIITHWHDRQITAGDEWAEQIDNHIESAGIILLLVSADFLASDYCYGVEMKRAMERHEAGEARVVPIILRPCAWHRAPFGKLQALPKDAKPVTTWSDRDEALLNITQGIHDVANRIRQTITSDKKQLLSQSLGTLPQEIPGQSKSIKILALTANPVNTIPLRLDQEVREIEEGLRRAKQRDHFTIEQKWAVRVRDLRRAMLDANPQIVHFSGHGMIEGLILEDSSGKAQLVSAAALSSLFELFADGIECVLLNACYSAFQAEAISRHIRYVIGMKKEIGDRAAIEFAVGFYDALGAGKSIEVAYRFGCNAIQLEGIPEHLTPIIIKKGELSASSDTGKGFPEGLTLNESRKIDPGRRSFKVHFELTTPTGLRRVIFGLEKSIADNIRWKIFFQLFERRKKSSNFASAIITLDVEVDKTLFLKAERVAKNGLTQKQSVYALGPAADDAKAAANGELDPAEAQKAIQDTLRK